MTIKKKTKRLKMIKRCDCCGKLSHAPDWKGVPLLGWRLCQETSFNKEPWECDACQWGVGLTYAVPI